MVVVFHEKNPTHLRKQVRCILTKKTIYLFCALAIGILIGISYPVFHVSLKTAQTLLYVYIIAIVAVNTVRSYRKKETAAVVLNIAVILLALWFMIRMYL